MSMTNAEIDGFLDALVARRDEILLKPQCYRCLGQVVTTLDRVSRRNVFRAFIGSPDGAIYRELQAFRIELPHAILDSSSGKLSMTEASEKPIGASALREEEIADKERLADSNRARAYISSTF